MPPSNIHQTKVLLLPAYVKVLHTVCLVPYYKGYVGLSQNWAVRISCTFICGWDCGLAVRRQWQIDASANQPPNLQARAA